MKIQFSKHILPHLIAVAAFLFVTVAFFNPIFFENKGIDQYDIQMWEGSSKALRDYRDQTGEEGLWAPSMFSGMPAYLINVDWGNGPILFIKQVMTLGIPHPISNIFAAFICYYILLLSFGVRPYLAIPGALAFGLSSYMIIGLSAGHNGRIGAIAFMPMVVAGIHLVFSRRFLSGAGVAAMGLALHLRENHLQITYYLLMIVGVYGLIQLIDAFRSKQLAVFAKSLGILIVAAILSVGSFFGPFWAITEYTTYSMRGPSELVSETTTDTDGLDKSYAFEGKSNGIWEPLVMLVPNFYGGSSMNLLVNDRESNTYQALANSRDQQMANQLAYYSSPYWGPQPLTAPYYAGAIICLLFVVGFAFAERKYVWWLVSVSILSIMLTWGDNFSTFNYFLFDHLPGYNKFRSATFALVIALFSLPLLGSLGLQRAVEQGWSRATSKKWLWAVSITGGICLILAVTGGSGSFMREGEENLPMWFLNALREDRIGLLRSDAWRSFLFILLFAAVFFARMKQWIKDPVFALIAFVLVTVDLTLVDKRYFTNDKFKSKRVTQKIAPTEADKEIMRDKGYYRVYKLPPSSAWSDARTSYFHNSVGGYHGAKMRRYQDLFDSCLFRQTQGLIDGLRSGSTDFSAYGSINMLNIKYLVPGSDRNSVIPNPYANGPAWFVGEVRKANSPNEELAMVCEINTRSTAVVDGSRFDLPAAMPDSTASITLTEHAPNRLKYESSSAQSGFAVFSEIYYPKGWTASIDGQQVPILRADYVLRALAIPAGKHIIEFSFDPAPYRVGNPITTASSWLVLLFVLGAIGIELRKFILKQ